MDHRIALSLLSLTTAVACSPIDEASAPEGSGEVKLPETPEDDGRATVVFRGEAQGWDYEVVNGKLVTEGDIVFGKAPPDGLHPISAYEAGKLWTVNPIPWRFNQTIFGVDDLTAAQKQRWRDAVEQWERFTPLRFVEDTGKTASKYINVKDVDTGDPDGCRSEVGMPGWGDPDTDLWVNDCRASAIAHEIGHAVGLKHEQSRPDRNTYVDYDSSCVRTFKKHNFSTSGTTAAGPFNFDSVMMYSSYAWGKTGPYELEAPNVDATPDFFVFDVTPLFTRSGEGPAVYQSRFTSFDFRLVYERGSGSSLVTEAFIDSLGTALADAPAESDGYTLDVVDGGALSATDNPSGFNLLIRIDRAAVLANPNLVGETLAQLSDPNNWTAKLEDDAVDPSCPSLIRAGFGLDDPGALWGRNGSLANAGDLSALWSLYEASPFTPDAAGDEYGAAVATGDFDGDGLQDAAIAMPGANAVALYRGAYDQSRTDGLGALVPWRRISVAEPRAVVAGDFNGDHFDDLAIGSPNANGTAGAVTVLLGSSEGVDRGSVVVSEPTTEYRLPFLPSAFTASSSIGATPTKNEVPVSMWPSACALAGAEGAWGVPGDQFGSALHATDLDGDGQDDLIVGAPGAASALDAVDLAAPGFPSIPGHRATGVVLVLMGHQTVKGAPPLEMSHTLSPYTATTTTGQAAYKGGHAGARFGASIASADLDGDGCRDLVIGAPEDVPSFYGSSPPEVDGTHLSGGLSPAVRSGRVWGFRTHHGDHGCFRVYLSTSTCDLELRSYVDYEEPDQNDGANYGFSVAADGAMFNAGGLPVAGIVVGAPGSPALLDRSPVGASGRVDVYTAPAADAGLRFVKTPDRALRQDLTKGMGPDGEDEPNDAFGHAVAFHGGVLIVGAPGDSHGLGGPANVGVIYRFTTSGSSSVLPNANVSGMTGVGAAPGARYGAFVGFALWDNNSGAVRGPVIGAPFLLDSEADPVGAVDWQRGVTTAAGTAFVSPGWLTMVEP
ncbi:MAG: FG-GAP repeat protein [Myxococcales bacterium]|nr:FG-GAP repeat protein [Myxococcales bacterium]